MKLLHYFKTNQNVYLWLKYKGSKIKAVTKISSCGTDLVIVPNPHRLRERGDTHFQCVRIYTRLRVLNIIICYTTQTKTHLSDATLYPYIAIRNTRSVQKVSDLNFSRINK
jgi:hypothetical protein